MPSVSNLSVLLSRFSMEGLPIWGGSCSERGISGRTHTCKNLPVQTLCCQSSGKGSIQCWNTEVRVNMLRKYSLSTRCVRKLVFFVLKVQNFNFLFNGYLIFFCFWSSSSIEGHLNYPIPQSSFPFLILHRLIYWIKSFSLQSLNIYTYCIYASLSFPDTLFLFEIVNYTNYIVSCVIILTALLVCLCENA